MARQANYLSDLMTQSEIIRFEVVDAQRVDYSVQGRRTPTSSTTSAPMTYDFATSVDFIYWPFNGEFWQDELGYYHYTEQGSCQVRLPLKIACSRRTGSPVFIGL